MKNNSEKLELNSTLINTIAPMGLEIKGNCLIIGENTGKVYGIVIYPQRSD